MRKLILAASIASLGLLASTASAGVAFPEPPGGWTYIYRGDKDTAGDAGSGFTSLDGTWSHDNGSDEWDGSKIGGEFGDGNRPGGAMTVTEGGITYLRIQDTGDPRDYGYADPGSNRKIYFGHSLTERGASENVMDEGITLSFRARIPTPSNTTAPLDPWHRDGQQAAGVRPYPAEGDGYVTSDQGKGNFVIRQAGGAAGPGGAIAFSLTVTNDTTGGGLTPVANFRGLTMNENAGNVPAGAQVNFGMGTGTNVVAFDPTQWHEFWIVLRKDPANVGTHQGFIYMDGSLTPRVFSITAGTDSDFGGTSYLAMGMTATPQNAALDVDFVAYKLEAAFPPGFAEPPGGWTYRYDGDKATAGEAGSGFTSLDGTWSHDNGSDEWDGSVIGGQFGDGNRPGGAMSVTESGVTYLRIQDTGDPRDYGYADPGSNRKIYFGHSLTERGASENVMDEGITLSFRARIPTPSNTTAPLDPWHRDGQQAAGVRPYPAEGDGYVTSDQGKGNFVIRQAGGAAGPGGAIAFSLTVTNDTTGGGLTPIANFRGLTMNENAGNVPAGAQVNFGMGTGTNVVAFDPTQWHEFWIVLRKDPANVGTHQGFIYMDGSLTPRVFSITAGTDSDFAGTSYLAIGMTATPQNAALDIDFVAYKLGAFFPSGAIDNLPPEITNFSPLPNSLFYAADKGITFTASTVANNSLPATGVKLTLNGQDLSSGVNVAGTPQNRSVAFTGLKPNTFYQGEVIVADQAGRASTNKLSFDTFTEASTVVIEAEEYNHTSGQFQDNPPAGGYLDSVGTPDVDYSDTTAAPGAAANHVYRTADNVSTRNSVDTRRQKYITADLQEVHVALLQPNEWLNYTRTFPNNRYNVYLRASSTAAQQVRLDRVSGDRTQPNQTTTPLGNFKVSSTGNANSFAYTPLTDAQGNAVALDLSGVQTLRLTALDANNNLNLNFLVFAPAPAVTEPRPVTIGSARLSGGSITFSFPSEAGKTYRVEYKDSLSPGSWTLLTTINSASAGTQTATDMVAGRTQRFYRVVAQ